MPRLPRIYIKGALYYITCRGESEQEIFKDEGDYRMFLDLLKKYQDQYAIKIFAYALMPSHLHLLVEMNKEAGQEENKSMEISDFMHNLNNSYTKYFNSRYERKGHLFRERFKAALVEKENYLLKMTAYIHLNPKRINLAAELKDYPYSSYSLYLYNKSLSESKDLNIQGQIAQVMGLLGNQDYASFVSAMTQEVGEFMHKNLQRGGVLGSEDFIAQVKSQIKNQKEKADAEKIATAKNNYKLLISAGSILLVVMSGAAGMYLYLANQKTKVPKAEQKPVTQTQKQEEWRVREWDVKLTPVSGGETANDTLNFVEGRFISARLYSLGYQSSNYTVVLDSNGKVVWETMQSAENGTASWHGEIEHDKMNGILSLRQEGKEPQDFSFISTGYRRRQ
ncbi:MAG: transposase [Candidatus Omnitrophica bacterium]|nr:transposase [Candidatus Omnitrophota bacterium]